MKKRFPTTDRARWRERFLAIGRQADAARRAPPLPEMSPRRPADPALRSAIRVRCAALTSHS